MQIIEACGGGEGLGHQRLSGDEPRAHGPCDRDQSDQAYHLFRKIKRNLAKNEEHNELQMSPNILLTDVLCILR